MQTNRYSQNRMIISGKFNSEKEYWLNKFKGPITMSGFVGDKSRLDFNNYQKKNIYHCFPDQLTQKLVTVSRSSTHGVYILLLTGVMSLLQKYNNSNQITVGIPEWKPKDKTPLVNNTLILQSELVSSKSFKAISMDVRQATIEANENHNFPFKKILEITNKEQNLPFKTMVLLEQLHDCQTVDQMETDIVFNFNHCSNKIDVQVTFNGYIFSSRFIKQLLVHLERLLTAGLQKPDLSLEDIEIMSKEERNHLLYEFNPSSKPVEFNETIQQLLEEQARKNPFDTAFEFKDYRMTYKELNSRANQFAHLLTETYGVKPNELIAVMLDRGPELIVTLYGILKAGAAYIPIDTGYPSKRIQHIFEESGTKLVVTTQKFSSLLQGKVERILPFCKDIVKLNEYPTTNPVNVNKLTDLTYIMYTSGTTGKPKGVMVTQLNILSFCLAMDDLFKPRRDDVFLAFSSISFDISVVELIWTITRAIPIIIVPNDNNQYRDYDRFVSRQGLTATIIQCTTSRLKMLVDDTDSHKFLNSLRIIAGGGETFSANLGSKLKDLTEAKILNTYGPTETTVSATGYVVKGNEIVSVPIGKPISNTWTYILNENLNLVPTGVSGELYLGGQGVSKGYFGQSQLTKERFISNPFDSDPPILYKTGDIVRRNFQGEIEHLGRVDNQVKIRGYRIEIGEIESILLEYPCVKESCVISHPTEGESVRLIAYITMIEGVVKSTSDVHEHLMQYLPVYMIPSEIVIIDEFPILDNGKINYKFLLKGVQDKKADYQAPKTPMEKALVQMWSELLSYERIAVTNNFFEIGGNSLMATIFANKVHNTFGVRISLRDILKYPTIAEIAKFIKTIEPQSNQPPMGITRVPRKR